MSNSQTSNETLSGSNYIHTIACNSISYQPTSQPNENKADMKAMFKLMYLETRRFNMSRIYNPKGKSYRNM